MKIKEIRLVNLTIKQNDAVIFQGKSEDVPEDLRQKDYKKIYFEGVDMIVEI